MSASPAERTPGRTPGRTPNGTVLPPIRRPKPPVDPLVRPKKRVPRPQATSASTNSANPNAANATNQPGGITAGRALAQHPVRPQVPMSENPALNILGSTGDTVHSGFSSEPVAPYVDYPLILSKRQLMEGMRSHVARFFSKKTIDPRNEEDFKRPVTLNRRDMRAPAPGSKEVDGEGKSEEADEEREKQELIRAEREAKREAEMKEIAPSANNPQKQRNNQKKKTQQVFRHDQTEEQKAETKLRYEEALHWHLDDFDNKQTWVGNYEAALSETYAQLIFKDGKFVAAPLEKWYKFTPKVHKKTLQLEEAEKQLAKKVKDPDWFVKSQEQTMKKRMEEMNRRATSRLFVGKVIDSSGPSVASNAIKRESGEIDELDFEEDRFADDEEPDLFEGEQDETKEVQKRIQTDQLQANIFNLKEEKAYDKAEELEKLAKRQEKEYGKRVKKALMKRERNYIYDSDSENPYSEESESTDSEAERLKEEEAKKEAEQKEKQKDGQPGSGASSKGTNTPSKSNKHLDPSSQRNLKRPGGSANASEASGNESSRKKQKKKHVNFDAGTSTPNGLKSRSRSPAVSAAAETLNSSNPQRKLSASVTNPGNDTLKRNRAAGSGSDGEGAGSGGEMSDGSRKRIKINVKKPASSTNASPDGSRSPSVERSRPEAGRGRAGSPGGKPAILPPTPAEVEAAIPEDGISIKELFKKLQPGGQMTQEIKDKVFKILRSVSQYDKSTKLLKRLK